MTPIQELKQYTDNIPEESNDPGQVIFDLVEMISQLPDEQPTTPIGKPGESGKVPSILSIALKSIAALSECKGSRNVAKEALQKYASQSLQTGTQGEEAEGIIKFIDETIDNYKKQIGPSYSQPYFFTKLKEMISEFSPHPSPVREEDKMKVVFLDCWGIDKRIPEEGRWMATIHKLLSVVAPTKERAFEEAIKSLSVLIAYNSDYKLPIKYSNMSEIVFRYFPSTEIERGRIRKFKEGSRIVIWVDENSNKCVSISNNITTLDRYIRNKLYGFRVKTLKTK